MNSLTLYKRYAAINFRCIMQYHTWPISILTTIVNSVVDFLGVIILFARFGSIGNWTSNHVLLLYGIATTSFGLAEWFSRGFDIFPWHVNSGEFDRVLLRPRNTFLQVMGGRFEFQRFGRVAVGICCILYSVIHLKVSANPSNILILIGAVIGGWFVYTSIFIILSAISFWTLQPLDIMYIFTNATLQYCKIPLPLLGKTLQNFLTFIMPLGLCYYYPAMVISKNSSYPTWTGVMALPGGIIFFIFSLLLWSIGVKHYHSSGS